MGYLFRFLSIPEKENRQFRLKIIAEPGVPMEIMSEDIKNPKRSPVFMVSENRRAMSRNLCYFGSRQTAFFVKRVSLRIYEHGCYSGHTGSYFFRIECLRNYI